ncbi:MAG: tetratricopeptide repeat protein [Chloroflexota bacterium]
MQRLSALLLSLILAVAFVGAGATEDNVQHTITVVVPPELQVRGLSDAEPILDFQDRLRDRVARESVQIEYELQVFDGISDTVTVDEFQVAPGFVRFGIAGFTVDGDVTAFNVNYMPDAMPLTARSSFLSEPFVGADLRLDDASSVDLVAAHMLYTLEQCDATNRVLASLGDESGDLRKQTLTASCAILIGDLGNAAVVLSSLLESDTAMGDIGVRAWAAGNLAWVRQTQGDVSGAFALLDALVTEAQQLSIPAVTAAAIAKRAELYALTFDFDAAIADITTAIELNPDSAQYHKQRGDHIFLIYEWDRVLDDYNRALELDPVYADAYFARGVLFYTQGPRPNALEDFQRFVELAPNDRRVPEAEGYIESIQAELEALGGDDTGAFGPSG